MHSVYANIHMFYARNWFTSLCVGVLSSNTTLAWPKSRISHRNVKWHAHSETKKRHITPYRPLTTHERTNTHTRKTAPNVHHHEQHTAPAHPATKHENAQTITRDANKRGCDVRCASDDERALAEFPFRPQAGWLLDVGSRCRGLLLCVCDI